MPLHKGTSQRTFKKNVAEFQTGNRFEKTRQKSGLGQAIKQSYAAAYRQKRVAARKKAARGRGKTRAK